MTIFHAIILAIVEGFTEFLPISSTGHMILTSYLLGIQNSEFVKSFEIFIQLGAILAVVYLYRKTLTTSIAVWQRILAAFIPTAIIGFIFYGFVKAYLLENVYVTLFALLIGGILLILLEKIFQNSKQSLTTIEALSIPQAVVIGIFQSIAIIPGVSRAAATIIGGLLLGTKRKAAVEFSFLLAVPTMAAATGLDLVKSDLSFSPYEYALFGIGFVVSFFVAILSVKFLLKFIQTHTFTSFGVYRIILAVLYLLLL